MNILRSSSSRLSKTTAGLQYCSTMRCLRIFLSVTRNKTRRFSTTHRRFSSTEAGLASSNAVCSDQLANNAFPYLGFSDKSKCEDHVSYPITLVLDNEGKTKRREDIVERIDSKNSGGRRYKLTADNGEVIILPSVTTVLRETAPIGKKIALDRWRDKIVKQYGAEAFDEMQKITVNNGKIFHQVSQTLELIQ